MCLPGDDIISRVRQRLCDRLVREAHAAGDTFTSDCACLAWVVLGSQLFDQGWLEDFFPCREPVSEPPKDRIRVPNGRVGGRTLQEWWAAVYPRLLAWGRQQPCCRYGYGIEGLLGEAYVWAVELWPQADGRFPLPPARRGGPVTERTDSAFEWITALVRRLAQQHPGGPVVALAYDPADRFGTAPTANPTATHLPDRRVMAQRVGCLSLRLPVPVPRFVYRFGGRGTLQLLLVADQLEVALGLADHYRLQWCLQTLAGHPPGEVAQQMGTTEQNVRTRFCRIRAAAQKRLVALWCRHVPGAAPAPELEPEEAVDE